MIEDLILTQARRYKTPDIYYKHNIGDRIIINSQTKLAGKREYIGRTAIISGFSEAKPGCYLISFVNVNTSDIPTTANPYYWYEFEFNLIDYYDM